MIPFLVCQFEKHTVSNLVKECFGSDFPDIFQKNQIDYIFRYLQALGAKSVLLEFEYVDRDYIEDYSRYYVKRFNNLGHRCARLHFFTTHDLDHGKIDKILAEGDRQIESDLQRAYLGYMVIKPLPKTFIGRTCLKIYPNISNSEEKLLKRTYNVNLFGLELKVDSIAFQEQDKVVSACATTAIWCTLHALDWWQTRNIPSCSEITTNAINFIPESSNSFPKTELSNKQILRALDVAGLRHHTESAKSISDDKFFEIVRSYIDSDLPLILGADVYSSEKKRKGAHAVCVVGYKLEGKTRTIYVHDDRLGPYVSVVLSKSDLFREDLERSWILELERPADPGEKRDYEVFLPTVIITATHKKVRIPLSYALNTGSVITGVYDKRVMSLTEGQPDVEALRGQVTFKVRLAEGADLKRSHYALQPSVDAREEELELEKERQLRLAEGAELEESQGELQPGTSAREAMLLFEKERSEFLTTSIARFQWVIDFFYGKDLALSVLIDATDIPQGHAVSAVLVKNIFLSKAILSPFKGYVEKRKSLEDRAGQQDFFSSFLRRLEKENDTFSAYLDSTYGQLRAPRYIKADEFDENGLRENDQKVIYYDLSSGKTLEEEFADLIISDPNSYRIWAINRDGNLLVGKETKGMGHPCLTGFEPARIAGELKRTENGWLINSKSGRYSSDYSDVGELLENVVKKFKAIFTIKSAEISISPPPSSNR